MAIPVIPAHTAPPTTEDAAFAALAEDVRACYACDRMAHAHVLSSANGALGAPVLFIAEAVGRYGGAVTGVPLTGDESGRRFTNFLSVAGMDRADAFVTNAVLCNPLDAHGRNRAPTARESARCSPFLVRTLETVRAPLVVSLGRVALDALRNIDAHDGALRTHVATPIAWRGRTLVPMYHPGRQALLHRSQEQQLADWQRLGAIAAAQRRG